MMLNLVHSQIMMDDPSTLSEGASETNGMGTTTFPMTADAGLVCCCINMYNIIIDMYVIKRTCVYNAHIIL